MWPFLLVGLLGVGGYVALRKKTAVTPTPAKPNTPSTPVVVPKTGALSSGTSAQFASIARSPLTAGLHSIVTTHPITGAVTLPAATGSYTPVQVTGDPLVPIMGSIYAVAVNLHGAISGVPATSVVSKAQSMGFANVTASKTRPVNFPGGTNAQWYVIGTYNSTCSKPIARNQGTFLAGANVLDVWQVG